MSMMSTVDSMTQGTNKAKLKALTKLVENDYKYWNKNIKRFQEFKKYISETTITDNQRSVLNSLQRPEVEFNILNSYVARLLGEFSQHEPSLYLTPAEGEPLDEKLVDLLEGHIRHIMETAKHDATQYHVVKDMLCGGFGVLKVYTEYSHPMSMRQVVCVKKAFDACLTYFDPKARNPVKDDGDHCGEVYPVLMTEAKQRWPNKDLNSIRTSKNIGGFAWAYKDSSLDEFILVCEHYEKKKVRKRLFELTDGQTMLETEYNNLIDNWDSTDQMPLVARKRWTYIEKIMRYIFTQNVMLEEEETDYDYFPLIFCDGDSEYLSAVEGVGAASYQFTKPFVYHARGVQNFKNCAGQSWANAMENQVQHKFIIRQEAIPQQADYRTALTNIQQIDTIVVKSYVDNDPEKPIPDPIREVMPVPMPVEISQAFQVADLTAQVILGGHQSNPGSSNNYISGEAIVNSISISNAAAMPYIANYLNALSHLGTVVLSLIPKYLIDERHLPVIDSSGEKGYEKVNSRDKSTMHLKFDPRNLKIEVKAGINFQIQKQQAMAQINAFCKDNEGAREFFNSPQGLPIVFKNLTIYGAEEIQTALEGWLQDKQKQQQQAMAMHQQELQNDPGHMIAQAQLQKNQIQSKEIEYKHQIEIAKLQLQQEKTEADIIKIMSEASNQHTEAAIRQEELQVSKTNHALDAVAKLASAEKDRHGMIMEAHQMHHEMKLSEREAKLAEDTFAHEREMAKKSTKSKSEE